MYICHLLYYTYWSVKQESNGSCHDFTAQLLKYHIVFSLRIIGTVWKWSFSHTELCLLCCYTIDNRQWALFTHEVLLKCCYRDCTFSQGSAIFIFWQEWKQDKWEMQVWCVLWLILLFDNMPFVQLTPHLSKKRVHAELEASGTCDIRS